MRAMDSLAIGTVVESRGKRGVVVADNFGTCEPDETPVVWEGQTYFSGTPPESLTVIGPENPQVGDGVACGRGQGERACIFLGIGPGGFECLRFHRMRDAVLFRDQDGMRAKYHPAAMYPACQPCREEAGHE